MNPEVVEVGIEFTWFIDQPKGYPIPRKGIYYLEVLYIPEDEIGGLIDQINFSLECYIRKYKMKNKDLIFYRLSGINWNELFSYKIKTFNLE